MLFSTNKWKQPKKYLTSIPIPDQSQENVLQVDEELLWVEGPVLPGAEAGQDALLEGLGSQAGLDFVMAWFQVREDVW